MEVIKDVPCFVCKNKLYIEDDWDYSKVWLTCCGKIFHHHCFLTWIKREHETKKLELDECSLCHHPQSRYIYTES